MLGLAYSFRKCSGLFHLIPYEVIEVLLSRFIYEETEAW